MAQPNLNNDIGTLLKLPSKVFNELTDKATLCIGSIISDSLAAGEQAVIINIGIGTLSIDLVDMQCKFVPSKDLKLTIKDCLETKVDPLELQLESALADRLIAACDEAI